MKPTSDAKNSATSICFKGPPDPSCLSLGQFLMMKMSQSKLSMSSFYYFKLMIIVATPKIHFISICEPTMPRNWWTKTKNIGKLYRMICPPNKRFLIFVSCKGIVEIVAIHFQCINNNIIIQHNLPKKQIIILNYLLFWWCFDKVQMKEHM